MNIKGGTLSQDEGLYSKKALMVSYGIKGIHGLEEDFFRFFNDDTDMLEKGYAFNTYTYMMGLFYHIFGYQVQAARLIGVILNIISFLTLFYLGKFMFGRSAGKTASAIFAFFPSIMAWSVAIGTDSLAILCILAYLNSLVRLTKGFSAGQFFIAVFAAISLMSVKHYIFILLVLVAVITFLVILLGRYSSARRATLILLIICVPALFYLSTNRAMTCWIDDISNKLVSDQGAFAALDDGGYFTYPTHCYKGFGHNMADIVLGYANGMRYAVFAPFPWKIESRLQLMAYPQMAIWYFMLPFIILGMYLAIKGKNIGNIPIISYLILVFSIFALAEANVGALFRHRDMATPFCLIYFSVGAEWVRQKYFT
jgi:4-amino-4-deoxy-L-arabinose transferase-like glycosyltransferase